MHKMNAYLASDANVRTMLCILKCPALPTLIEPSGPGKL